MRLPINQLSTWNVAVELAAGDSIDGQMIARSSGTVVATGKEFEPNAVIPAAPWLTDLPSSVFAHLATQGRPQKDIIHVLRIPNPIIEGLRNFAKEERQGLNAQLYDLAPELVPVLTPLAEWLHNVAQFSSLRPNGLLVHRRSTVPMTIDPETGLKVGLHVDSWERLFLYARQQGRLRLCVNLGVCDRFFLFVPLTVVRVAEILHLTPETQRYMYSATEVARSFLLFYPTIPVLRVRIRPGCAYIAPTENLIHDACAAKNHGRDISLHATIEQ